mmetsp:Transcript_3837/g.4893  ORF Transcript_3837/g.4893 Transcript_3837/m.4893 type:complete len:127 (+) Transcript_3837:77-457(+)
MTSAAFRESEDDAQFPNAIKKGKHIMAQMRDNKSHKLAKILDVRKPKKDDDIGLKNNNQEEAKKDTEMKDENADPVYDYEYYVNYLELERRNDRWVPESFLQIDEDLIESELNRITEENRVMEEKA